MEKGIIESVNPRFHNWFNEPGISNEFILDLINKNYSGLIKMKLDRLVNNYELNEVFGIRPFINGYVKLENFDYVSIQDINIDVFKNEAIISGNLIVKCNAIGFEYNKAKNDLEDSESYFGKTDIVVLVAFSFAYDKNKTCRKFDVDSVDLL
jgi:hypothetical protein